MSDKWSILDQFTAKVAQVIKLHRFDQEFDQEGIFSKFSSQALQMILLAQEESRHLNHNYVGTEQILIGLIAEQSGFSAQILKTVGVTFEEARVEVEKIIGRGRKGMELTTYFTPRAKRAFEYAAEESRKRAQNYIGTEHILLGVLRSGEGVAIQVLQAFGLDIDTFRKQVLEEMKVLEIKTPATLQAGGITRWTEGIAPAFDKYSTPVDFTSGVINTRFCRLLSAWVEPRQLGYVVSSNSGFQSSNGEILAPHIAYYSSEHLKQIPRTYPESLPSLVVEIKSAFEQFTALEAKVLQFLELGISAAVLINPDQRTVSVYVADSDQNHSVTTFKDGEKLTLPTLFPEWEVNVAELWPHTFN